MEEKNLKRREFLKLAAVGAAVTATMQVARKGSASPPEGSSPHSWAMVIDRSKCTGCNYCTKACQAENDIAPDIRWNKIYEVEQVGDQPTYLSIPCMQCAHAPCVDACPVKATYYRPDGIVMMNYDRCIGCRYCEIACPYGARSFNWKGFDSDNPQVPAWGQPQVERRPRGVVEKCAFCYHRIDRGLAMGLTPGVGREATPACVGACPNGARLFGDLNDPESVVSQVLADNPYCQLRTELGTEPRVYYLPVDRNGKEMGS